MTPLTGFTESVLRDAPRFSLEDRFCFECHPGVPCFNQCCADINIFLTPYDVLRLKNALGMSSAEFLEKHTLLPFTRKQTLPTPLLRMEDNEAKTCPFVTPEGCGVYRDRPWACRMYPLGLASPRQAQGGAGAPDESSTETFYFVLQEEMCRGHEEKREWSVREWLEDQGVTRYNQMGEHYKELTLAPVFQQEEGLDPKKMEMFYTAMFDLDAFRRFIFTSSFLDRFEVPADTVTALRDEDEALLLFGFEWLKFALLRKPTMKVRPEAVPNPPATKQTG